MIINLSTLGAPPPHKQNRYSFFYAFTTSSPLIKHYWTLGRFPSQRAEDNFVQLLPRETPRLYREWLYHCSGRVAKEAVDGQTVCPRQRIALSIALRYPPLYQLASPHLRRAYVDVLPTVNFELQVGAMPKLILFEATAGQYLAIYARYAQRRL